MKYFTDELWSRMGGVSAKEREQTHIEWVHNCEAYWKVFETIKHRLSKKFLKVYSENDDFHDCDFLSFEVTQPQRWASDPVKVRIVISDGEFKWTLTYKQVKKAMMNYDSETDEHMSKWGVHTWGYDEFLPKDDAYLTHEVLFASGASILIEFKNKNLFIDREPMGKSDDKDNAPT